MPAFTTEMHVERGGPAGRNLGYCLQAAAELGRFFERADRQRSGSSAGSERSRAKIRRRSWKRENRKSKETKGRAAIILEV